MTRDASTQYVLGPEPSRFYGTKRLLPPAQPPSLTVMGAAPAGQSCG